VRIRTLTTVAALLTSAIATIPAAPAQAAAGRTTELTVVYRADTSAQALTMHLHCNPDGGDQPRVAEACDDLAALDADRRDPFAPPADDQICAVEYDGPQTAVVSGRWGTEPVHASFARTNQCETSRWNSIEAVLDPDPHR
jgi:Subtilisin inhibitor-like